MRFFLLLLLSIFSLSYLPNVASAACYSAVEAEADQGLRIHSELMVIALNCQHMGVRHGENLYTDYKEFTNKHADLFEIYEKILMKFYQAQGEGESDAEAQINTLRTTYANKISNDAAKMRPDVFCSRYAPRILKALKMEQLALRQWAATIYPSHPVSYPVCGG